MRRSPSGPARRRWRGGLPAAALLGAVVLAGAPPLGGAAAAQEPASEGVSIWRLSLYKTIAFEAAANLGDVALFAMFFGGGPATAAGFFAINVATASVAYYAHEIAWDYYGPPVDPGNEIDVTVRKTLTYRVVSATRNVGLSALFGGGLATTIGFTIASQVMDTTFYVANELLWTRFGPPVAR
ncbi:MAG: hypothetical protein IT561_12665 [Alphaproteobacteria bacterium]|nr:hypothetical protein [Alphaproteobacteria bacterium]